MKIKVINMSTSTFSLLADSNIIYRFLLNLGVNLNYRIMQTSMGIGSLAIESLTWYNTHILH